jgi:hypothetical protein
MPTNAACPREKSPVNPVKTATPRTATMLMHARVTMERM